MSRESPGKRTFFSASSTSSCVAISILLLFEALVRGTNDRNRLFRGGDDGHHVEIAGADQTTLDHRLLDPVDQTGPHCTDEDERMLCDVLHLQKLPDHEQLERGSYAAGKDDERRRQPDEVVQPREERSVAEDLVDEWVGAFFLRKMDGEAERARVALDLPFDRAGVRRLHESGSAAGDDVHAHPRQLVAELLHLGVDRIARLDARAAEDRHAIVLDPLRLDLIEIVDRVPEVIDRAIENVTRIDR